jgi:hypothetical protein
VKKPHEFFLQDARGARPFTRICKAVVKALACKAVVKGLDSNNRGQPSTCKTNVIFANRDNVVTDRDDAVNGLRWVATP